MTSRSALALLGLTVSAILGAALGGFTGLKEPAPRPPVVIYEDGSGIQYVGDREVRTFPEGTFVWDCQTMGNRICG